MNKYFFKIKNYIKNLTKKNLFGSILFTIFIIFLFLLYFTIPVYYNYENFDKKLQKEILKDFKINLKNIRGVNYLILPTPHFLIEECDLFFSNDPKEEFAKIKNLKIKVYFKNLHKKEKIELKSLNFKKTDFDLQFVDLNNFYNHIKKNITKPIFIKNSNFFFRDQNKKIILISKINNIDYFIDLKNKEKKITILGNLFGSDFTFKWNKNYLNSYVSKSNLKFKNPNINILNEFNNFPKDFINVETNVGFLNNNLDLNYKFNKDKIVFIQSQNQNRLSHNSKLIGDINLNPFFFNLTLDLKNLSITDLLNGIFLNLYKSKKSTNLSFNGNFKINIDQINNRLFENLVLNINFLEGKVSLKDTSLYLRKIGKINFSDPTFIERDHNLFIKSKIKFDVDDQQELYRRFLIPRQNRINLNKVYFEVEYNIDDGNYFLSSINFNETENKKLLFKEINNIQQLTNLVSKEFKKVNLD